MTDVHWQLDGSAPELYQRYLASYYEKITADLCRIERKETDSGSLLCSSTFVPTSLCAIPVDRSSDLYFTSGQRYTSSGSEGISAIGGGRRRKRVAR